MNRPRRPQPMQPQQPMQRVSPGMYRNAQGGLQRGQAPMQRPMPQQRPPMQQPQRAPVYQQQGFGNQQQMDAMQAARNGVGQAWGQMPPPNGWGQMQGGQLNLQGTNPGNWGFTQMPQMQGMGNQPNGFISDEQAAQARTSGAYGQAADMRTQDQMPTMDQNQMMQKYQAMQKYPRPAYQPPANPQGLLSQPPMKE